MEPETLLKLFINFSQAHSSTTRRFGGSGLGLAISQQLVQRMGGEIIVTSLPRRGSEFSFIIELPITEFTTAPLPSRSPFPVPSQPHTNRVLVVDDDAVNRRVITKMLERLGFDSLAVEDGIEAIAHAQDEPWARILMDV
jgi:PleD family two-component response regulator